MPPGTSNGDGTPAAAQSSSRVRVGQLFGDVATNQFQFQVEDPDLSATSYISFEHADERFLAQVTQVEREVSGGSAGDEGDLVAQAKVIGRRDDKGRLALPQTPPKPGVPVHKAQAELVRSALNLDEGGAFLGLLRGLDLPVHVDVNELVQKHCSILAKTGAGKSYALGVLMEEMLKHEVPIVAIDPHGEHASLEAPNSSDHDVPLMRRFGVKPRSYDDQVVEYAVDTEAVPDAEPFRLDERDLSARDIAELLEDGLTSAQTGTLHQAVRELEDEGSYTLEDIIASVEAQSGSSKWPVLHALEDLQDLGILSSSPTPVDALVEAGQATVLNLKGLPPSVQQLVVARVAQELFEARKVGLVPPHLAVLEEAHNFAPERHLSQAASGEILRTIASEGRKFGMGLAVVSQRPAKVDKNVLSQCNTQIILKVTNGNDLKAISKSVEGLPPGMEDEIQALPVGTALVSEPTIAVPLFCEIRPRETRHGGSSIDVVRERGDDEASTASDEPDLAALEATSQSAEPSRASAGDEETGVQGSSEPEAPRREPTSTGSGSTSPASGDPRLAEVSRAEEIVGTARLGRLDPGSLEAILVEIEGLIGALDGIATEPDTDRARIAGLRSSLRAHHRRIQKRLDQRAG